MKVTGCVARRAFATIPIGDAAITISGNQLTIDLPTLEGALSPALDDPDDAALDAAFEAFRGRYLRRVPTARVIGALAYITTRQFAQDRGDDAVRVGRLATRVDPTSAVAWEVLGDCHNMLGQAEEAERHYRKALTIDPDNAKILSRLDGLAATR